MIFKKNGFHFNKSNDVNSKNNQFSSDISISNKIITSSKLSFRKEGKKNPSLINTNLNSPKKLTKYNDDTPIKLNENLTNLKISSTINYEDNCNNDYRDINLSTNKLRMNNNSYTSSKKRYNNQSQDYDNLKFQGINKTDIDTM